MKLKLFLNPFEMLTIFLALLTLRSLFGVCDAEHSIFALINPLVKQKIGDLGVLFLVLEALHDHMLYKMDPVGYSIN